MAGGQGTRLWPMSRQNRPKQLFDLVSNQTLLKDTIDRLVPQYPIDQIYIATNHNYVSEIRKQIPDFPAENIFSEPELRDTSACIGLATAKICKKDPDAVIAILPSDHYIEKETKFLKILACADKLCQRENQIVILGIQPTRPATELGYIHIKSGTKSINGCKVFRVKNFVEKPDIATAKKYVKSWRYFWNAGMFIYPAQVMLESFKKHMPQNYLITEKILAAIDTPQEKKVIDNEYKKYEKLSIDYGIMEKSDDLLMIPADIGWNDIGTWGALKDVLAIDETANVTKGNLITIDTTGSLIYGSQKPIATIGIDNLVIVDTDDILMICPKDKTADMKKLVQHLKDTRQDKLL